MLIIIAALSLNRVIGKDGKVPWNIPEDLHRFMHLTSDHIVLMGRRSFESLGKPLPNRRNIVLSSKTIEGVECYSSIERALAAVKNEEKVFVIGGGEIFRQMLHAADMMQLTIVERHVDGDTYFPPYEELIKKEFQLVFEERHPGFNYVDYLKKSANFQLKKGSNFSSR